MINFAATLAAFDLFFVKRVLLASLHLCLLLLSKHVRRSLCLKWFVQIRFSLIDLREVLSEDRRFLLWAQPVMTVMHDCKVACLVQRCDLISSQTTVSTAYVGKEDSFLCGKYNLMLSAFRPCH